MTRGDGMDMGPVRRSLALCLCVVTVLGLPSLVFPFGRDQGILAFVAYAMDQGLVPYRDVYSIKAPVTFLFHWVAQELFGHSMTAIRVLDLIVQTATAGLLFTIAHRMTGRPAIGIAAAILYGLAYFAHGFWQTAQTDGWTNLFLAGSMALVLASAREPGDRRRGIGLALAGVSFMLAALLKITIVVAGPALAAAWLMTAPAPRPVRRDGVAFAVGSGATGLVFLIALAAVGALDSYIDIQIALAAYVGLVGDIHQIAVRPLSRLFDLVPVVLLLTIVALLPARADGQSSARPSFRVVLGIWAVAGYLAGVVQGKGFLYHYLPLLPPLALLAASGLVTLADRIRPAALSRAAGAGVLGLAVLLSPLPGRVGDVARIAAGRMPLEDHWDTAFRTPDYHLGDIRAVAAHLSATTGRQDRLLVWGFDAGIYFLARRLPAQRFIFPQPLISRGASEAFRTEFLGMLSCRPPTVLVVARGDATPHATGHDRDSAASLEAWAALRQFRDRHYRKSATVGHFDVYQWQEDRARTGTQDCPKSGA